MRGHFRHLHFNSFRMTWKTPQGEVFWPLQLNSEVSGVPEHSQVPISGVWVSSSHSFKSGVVTRAMLSLVSPSLRVVRPSTKNAPTMHQLTYCLVSCKFVWVIKCLSFFLVPSQSFSTPLYPQSVAKERVPSLLFRYFHYKLTFECSKELGSASLIEHDDNLKTTLRWW
jgi:hypothetical protein